MKLIHKLSLGCMGIVLLVAAVGVVNYRLLDDIDNDINHIVTSNIGADEIRRDVSKIGLAASHALRYSLVLMATTFSIALSIGVWTVKSTTRDIQRLQKNRNDLNNLAAENQKRVLALEKAKVEAEAANRAKSEVLASMSHDLRTPLNHIIGFTELVVDDKLGPLNELQKEYLNDALTSSRQLLSLISDILNISKIEAGKVPLKPSNVNIVSLMNSCLAMFKEKAMKHHIEVSSEMDTIPETIWADEIKLKQIFYNLLVNAFEFTPDGGRIHVKAWPSEETSESSNGESPKAKAGAHLSTSRNVLENSNHLTIAVSDTGVGIEAGDLDRVFDPFHRVRETDMDRQNGTGLRLALIQRLVQQQGGRIWATSEDGNLGATMVFTLPLHTEDTLN